MIEIVEQCTFKIDFQVNNKTPCNSFYTGFIILLIMQSHCVYNNIMEVRFKKSAFYFLKLLLPEGAEIRHVGFGVRA